MSGLDKGLSVALSFTYADNMIPPSTVLDIFDDALGDTPGGITARGRALGPSDLAAIIDRRTLAPEGGQNHADLAHQIWPLLSHHTYGGRALFGGPRRDIRSRALTLLLLHDGLVVADPLESVHQILTTQGEDEAVVALSRATHDLAEVEPLIAGGVLRLTTLRPALKEANRLAVLEALGLNSDLRVFTNFIEAAGGVPLLAGSFERIYAPQVHDLYMRFGLEIPVPSTLASAERLVGQLAAAVIEVSWQFAVTSLDSSCDLAFLGPLEQHLAEALFEQGMAPDLGAARHASTLDLGRVPNLDTSCLTVADALALRQEDAFESFRQRVRLALDRLDTDRRAGAPVSSAHGAFEDAMREEARALRETAKRASFRDRLREVSMPAALGVVSALAVAPAGAVAAAGAAATIPLTTVIWQWLIARRDQTGQGSRSGICRCLGMQEGRQRPERAETRDPCDRSRHERSGAAPRRPRCPAVGGRFSGDLGGCARLPAALCM